MKAIESGKVFALDEVIEYAVGGIVSKKIVHTQSSSITLFSFDQGQRLSEHSAPFDALVTMIDGKAEIIIDGEVHYPKAGEAVIIPANHPHAINATTRFKMMLTMIRGVG